MGLTDPPTSVTDQSDSHAKARTALEAVLREHPEIEGFTLLEALRVTGKSWAFKAEVNGELAVVKRFLGGASAKTVLRLKVELDYLQTVFEDERWQANRCIYAWPQSGVAVLSFAPGLRLGDHIAAASAVERQELLTQSGHWLRQYCAPRQRKATFGPGFWVQRLADMSLDRVNVDKDQVMLDMLLRRLRQQAKAVKGTAVVQAATHGDFVAMNLHYHDGRMYGLDIQGESWLAIAKDAARFLVWLQIHEDGWPQNRQYGIGIEDLSAFLNSGVLTPAEYPTTLRFFIGEQLFFRFVENYRRRRIRDNARAAIEAYLQER